jgi:FAD/FMN-containing dehydrogenase
MLPYGYGRSYGDSCLNDGGVILDMRGLDRFIAFDPASGVLRCEAGVLLSEILELIVPQGWFLPVTPGTQFVTIGGAIANDVHGKNHHRAGTFGCHVRQFELLRSDGSRRLCSPGQNPDWLAATVGGLGLTGVITWAEIQLRRIANPLIEEEIIRCHNLLEFFAISKQSDASHEYTVMWIDCLARGKNLGRGLFMRGNHAAPLHGRKAPKAPGLRLSVPLTPPLSLINHASLRLFNSVYYRKPAGRHLNHYAPFFYPLDGMRQWNRLYGPQGLLQYQCAIPLPAGEAAIREILDRIAAAGAGSFLAVLKVFGNPPSPGMLSFPLPGVTLALDFPNLGEFTLKLLNQLDEVVDAAGGRLYPAKDARMSGAHFRRWQPRLEEFKKYLDPRFSSGFWRRVKID